MVADEQGLGKTIEALFYAQRHPELRPIVVVCGASLKWQWELEASRHIGMRALVLDGTRPSLKGISKAGNLYIVNYDILIQRRRDKANRNPGPGWKKWLKAIKPKIVIIDECQEISNPSCKQSRAVKSLCADVPSVLGLSGTPLTGKPSELWHICHILWPQEFPAFLPFAHEFCNPKRTPWGWDFSGSSKLDELHAKLLGLGMLRRLKKDVLAQLPPKTRQMVPLPLTDPDEYAGAVDDFRSWAKVNLAAGKARKALKAKALAKLSYLRQLAMKLKKKAAFDWLDRWLREGDGKIIVFAVHKAIIAEMHERWRKTSVVVTGDVIGSKRQAAVMAFQKSENVRMFLGNRAAYTGLNLTAGVATAVLELPWSPGDLSQLSARNDRIGQTQPTTDYYLLGKDTIDHDIAKILIRKMRVLDEVLDGGERTESQDIREALLKRISGF